MSLMDGPQHPQVCAQGPQSMGWSLAEKRSREPMEWEPVLSAPQSPVHHVFIKVSWPT